MKTFGVVVFLVLLGLTCGIVVSKFDIAFEPKHCGEDCVNIALGSLFTWASLCAVGFPVAGVFAWKRWGANWRALGVTSAALAAIAIVPAGALYFYRLSVLGLMPTG